MFLPFIHKKKQHKNNAQTCKLRVHIGQLFKLKSLTLFYLLPLKFADLRFTVIFKNGTPTNSKALLHILEHKAGIMFYEL